MAAMSGKGFVLGLIPLSLQRGKQQAQFRYKDQIPYSFYYCYPQEMDNSSVIIKE
jgi:hypothetical protein